MNQPFMFMPNLNPLADNPIFIKKAVRRKFTIIAAVSLAVALTAAFFGMLYSFGLSMNGATFYVSSYDQELQGAELSGFGMSLIIIIAMFTLPAIAAVNYSVTSKDKENPWFPASVGTLTQIFFVFFMLINIYNIFTSLASIGVYALMNEIGESSVEMNAWTDLVLPKTVPAMIGVVWAIGGLVFMASFKNTMKCNRLTDKGSGFFGIMSVIMLISNIVMMIVYNVNGFKGGMFFSLQSPDTLTVAINENTAAQICFDLFYIACDIAILMIMFFSTDFSRAIKKAKASFQAGGTNLYMNGDSTHAAYYQGYYNGQQPYGQQAPAYQPPVPVQQQFNNVQPGNIPQVQPSNDIPPMQPPINNTPPVQQSFNNETFVNDIKPDVEQYTSEPVKEENVKICRWCGCSNPAYCKYCVECGISLAKL